jgi:hypothetical protein
VSLGHFDLAAHRAYLARVLAVRMRVAGFEENLVLLAFSADIRNIGLLKKLILLRLWSRFSDHHA